MKKLSHIDAGGKAAMVDVSDKPQTRREALASGFVSMKKATLALVLANSIAKGDVLAAARIAAVMAAKKTSELIPLCHPLAITSVDVTITPDRKRSGLAIEARVRVTGQTGVEMEALTAVSVAALTIYDMCKAVDREMVVSEIMLLEKSGGKSGRFSRSEKK